MPARWYWCLVLMLLIQLGCFAQPWSPAWRGLSRANPAGVHPGAPLSRVAPLGSHAVKVRCDPYRVVVTVHRDLFGVGRLVAPTDLTLGLTPCLPVSFDAAADEVLFEAGLHQCGSSVQMTPDWLIYRMSLFYRPSLAANPVVVRTNAAEVPIECRYPRMDNVSSRAVKPTWAPFRSTVSAEARLGFSLRLMTDDWSAERRSTRFQLGDLLHLQADLRVENHLPLRLYVDSCVAVASLENPSAPQYAIVDSHGCLVDGKAKGVSSTFLSPRPRQEVLRFTVDAFRFAGNAGNLIYLKCHLKVTPAEQVPDASNKACSFRAASGAWLPVEGSGDICNCCETRDCSGGTLGEQPRGIVSPRHQPWEISGQRSLTVETDRHEARLALGPIAIFDSLERVRQVPGDAADEEEMVMEEGFLPVIESQAEATGPLFPFREHERSTSISEDEKDKPTLPLEIYLRAGPFFVSRGEEGSGFGEQAEAALADEHTPLDPKADLASRSLENAATSRPPGELPVEAVNLAAKGPEQPPGVTVGFSVLMAGVIVAFLALAVFRLTKRCRRNPSAPCPSSLSTEL
nr:zona pellucida sperm-binding protein 3-like isoform X1 [Pogona vitticeps]